MPDQPNRSTQQIKRPATKRRWRWVAILTLAPCLVVLFFGPAIVANTALRNVVARWMLANLHGRVTIDSASLSWFKSWELRDVVITEPNGDILCRVPCIRGSKSLYSLLFFRSDLGKLDLKDPVIELDFDDDGTSNLERVFAKYLASDVASTPQARHGLAVEVRNGRIRYRSSGLEVVGVEATLRVPESRQEAISLDFKAVSSSSASELSGSLQLQATLATDNSLAISAQRFPLETLRPVFLRFRPGSSVKGLLTADISLHWREDFSSLSISAGGQINEFELVTPWLQEEHLRQPVVDLQVNIESDAHTIQLNRAKLSCDLGFISVEGKLSRSARGQALLGTHVNAKAKLDLARLTQALPRWTHIREDTVVQSGTVELSLVRAETEQGTTWRGQVHAGGLRAERRGQSLIWEEPLDMEFAIRLAEGLPVVDSLVCRSDVLALQARGTSEAFKAAANIDLNRLTERLSRFINLDGIVLSGQALLRWEVSQNSLKNVFSAQGSIDLTDFQFMFSHWRYDESKLLVRGDFQGEYTSFSDLRIEMAQMTLTASEDRLSLTLQSPHTLRNLSEPLVLGATFEGDLQRWRQRLAGIIRLPNDWAMAGELRGLAKLTVASGSGTVHSLQAVVDHFRMQADGLNISDRRLEVRSETLQYDQTGKLNFHNLVIDCLSGTLAVQQLAILPQENGTLALSGQGNFLADLASIERWLGSEDIFAGKATGRFSMTPADGATEIDATATIERFACGPANNPLWVESSLAIRCQAALDPAEDEFLIRNVVVAGEGYQAAIRGRYARLSTTQDLDLDGTLTYDWAKLTPKVRAVLGGEFRAEGKSSTPFQIRGSLLPPPLSSLTITHLTASAVLAWQSLSFYGCDFAPANIQLNLDKGMLKTSPINGQFSDGTLRLLPTLELAKTPGILTLAKGTILERANLTPQTCAQAVGYALPVVAYAVQAQGQISFTIHENSIPLLHMNQTTLRGDVFVHSATLSTGPLVGELVRLLGLPANEVTLASNMAVPIHIERGRVHHQNLRLSVNGFSVTTRGSVGFDGSLMIVADVPVPAQNLFRNNPRLIQALSDKTIQVPINGSLKQPKLDPQGFQQAVGQLVREATKSLTTDLIKEGLDKLLPVPRK